MLAHLYSDHVVTQDAPLGRRIRGLSKRTRKNVAMVALAAKLARFAWAVLCKERGFDPAIAAGHANKDNRQSVHSRGIILVIRIRPMTNTS